MKTDWEIPAILGSVLLTLIALIIISVHYDLQITKHKLETLTKCIETTGKVLECRAAVK